jgi:hypothetical protein
MGIVGKPQRGHNMGTVAHETQSRSGNRDSTVVQQTVAPVTPRLLDLHTAAAYSGVSEWTVRDLEAAGTVPRIRIPLPNAGELRKLLFDRRDLDCLVDSWKDTRG